MIEDSQPELPEPQDVQVTNDGDERTNNFHSPHEASLPGLEDRAIYRDAPSSGANPDVARVSNLVSSISNEVRKAVIGQDDAVELLIAALLSHGHVLIEGVPGTAKTLLVRSLAIAISSQFKRIQFTPDLMPSDITGTQFFDQRTMEFHFKAGPIFTEMLLADEINRTPPKTQAALLEAMQERRVTVNGETFNLPSEFMVCATQNPVDFDGTYPLPEAQVDRFLVKIIVDYPTRDGEQAVLKIHHKGFDPNQLIDAGLKSVISLDELAECRELINTVVVDDSIIGYITDVVGATRSHRQLMMGAGPRASIALLQLSKSIAAMRGRGFVTPDDIKSIAPSVLRHRIILRPEAEIEGATSDRIVASILDRVDVPR